VDDAHSQRMSSAIRVKDGGEVDGVDGGYKVLLW